MDAIQYREGALAGARYLAGNLVYDELFRGGRLLSRYFSPQGQVWPEMHLEKRMYPLQEPDDAFALAVDGLDLRGGFAWVGAELTSATRGRFRLCHAATGIEVAVHTRVDGSPFLIRWLEITNRGDNPVGLTAVAPLAGRIWSHRWDEHVAAGAATPFELGYNRRFAWGQEGDFGFEPLPAGVKEVDGGRQGRSGYGRPAFWARNRCNGQTCVCELAWGGSYAFALDCRLAADRKSGALYFRIGLAGHDAVLRVLDPAETVVTPAVHIAMFSADLDAIVQATHEHVRRVVMPAQLPGREIEIEACHRGYLCDRENVPDLKADAEVAAAVGVELYVIDAGWYGREPNRWYDNTGDWQAGPWLEGGLEPVVAHARQLGMRFGLWVEAEAAGASSALRAEHPEWLLRRDGEPIANGRALDLTQPAVAAWIESEIDRLIRRYGLNMFRLDHNHALNPAGNRSCAGRTEDLTWRYYDALYGIFDRLRARHPQVVFQNCAGGGGRLDWGTLGRFHNTELSDWGRLPRGLKILNNVTLSLPPEVLLRTFGTESSELDLDGDLDAQLRLICLGRPILRGIAPRPAELSPLLRERITHHLTLYRDFLRPLLRGCRVFHHTPALPILEPTPWCVLEYASPDATRGAVVVFHTCTEGKAAALPAGERAESTYVVRPRGLDAGREYAVRFDNASQRCSVSGWDLRERGVTVRLERTQSSELLLFEAE